MDLWQAPVMVLQEGMRKLGLRRAYLVATEDGRAMRASHALLEPVAEIVSQDRRDFHGHEACFFELGNESGHLLSAALHWTFRGQGAGGVRFWHYDSTEAFIRDGLRLSRGMGHKNALAGLWWGGGKGVIARETNQDYENPAVRKAIYRDYGRFVSGLDGCYVTAEDVGTRPEDMASVFSTTRFVTCIPEAHGGSGNPSRLTAKGVVVAMEAALHHSGLGSLAGKTIAMQGLGHVASDMIGELLERQVARIVGADIDTLALVAVARRYPGAPLALRQVERGDTTILAEPCDILAPNAVGAILNATTIPTIQAGIVCGAANNQLEDAQRDGDLLQVSGVLYVPDFLANRMGIVNCANEQYGRMTDDAAIVAHLDRETPHGVFQRSLDVFRRAAQSGRSTAHEAQLLADELARELHPLWGNRSRAIVKSLVARDWEKG